MKKIILLISLAFGALILSACSKGVGAQFGPSEAIDGYEAYTLTGVQEATAAGDDVVLFFGATRCPPCVKLNKDIVANADQIPENLSIFALDYDEATELKESLDVTSKHTAIYLNHDGSVHTTNVAKEHTLDDILEQLAIIHDEDHQ